MKRHSIPCFKPQHEEKPQHGEKPQLCDMLWLLASLDHVSIRHPPTETNRLTEETFHDSRF